MGNNLKNNFEIYWKLSDKCIIMEKETLRESYFFKILQWKEGLQWII